MATELLSLLDRLVRRLKMRLSLRIRPVVALLVLPWNEGDTLSRVTELPGRAAEPADGWLPLSHRTRYFAGSQEAM